VYCAFAFMCRYDTMPPADAHLQRIADHVSAYLQIVRSQLLATVPKAIVHCMVRWVGTSPGIPQA
jgi:dynamin 1-like protein